VEAIIEVTANVAAVDTKWCGRCGEAKPAEAFAKHRSTRDGLQTQCRQCQKNQRKENAETVAKKQRERYEANKQTILEKQRQYRQENKDKIAARKKLRADHIAQQQREYRNKNAEKFSEQQREYRQANAAKISDYQKTYHPKYVQINAGKMAAYRREYYRSNADRITKRRRHRYAKDSWFRFAVSLRNRQGKFLAGIKRPASMVRDIGCDREFFLRHIASQFTAGMTMENHGAVWHLDHIYPLAKADLTDRVQFLAVANWRNLRPMLGPQNLAKGDEVTAEAQTLFDSLCRELAV
jgi:hypothetical protein